MADTSVNAGTGAQKPEVNGSREEPAGKTPGQLAEPSTHVSAGSAVGYARVSRSDQVLDRQTDALAEEGCAKIFTDLGMSGARSSRPGLNQALAYLRPGDHLVVTSLDRLGRRTSALLELVESLKERGVGLRVLALGLDTSTPSGHLVLTIMAALAEMERSILIDRTREGLEAAAKRGRRGGRPPALTDERRHEARRMHEEGRSVAEIARVLLVSERTIRRVCGIGEA